MRRTLTFPAYEAALEYLDLGLSFYPKLPRDKKPAFHLLPKLNGRPSWEPFKKQQPTREQARDWFKRMPTPNIAIITGPICVLDLDTAEAIEVMLQHGDIPHTPTARSRRGMHLYFRAPGAALRVDAIAGADLLSGGRCCTAPPSVHPSGHVYRWTVPLSVGFAELPGWIVEAAKKPVYVPREVTVPTGEKGERYALAALRGEVGRLLACGSGRNNATRKAAFCLKRFVPVLGYERLYEELLGAALSLGLPESEAAGVIRRGLRA